MDCTREPTEIRGSWRNRCHVRPSRCATACCHIAPYGGATRRRSQSINNLTMVRRNKNHWQNLIRGCVAAWDKCGALGRHAVAKCEAQLLPSQCAPTNTFSLSRVIIVCRPTARRCRQSWVPALVKAFVCQQHHQPNRLLQDALR